MKRMLWILVGGLMLVQPALAPAQTSAEDVSIQDIKAKKIKGIKQIHVEQFTIRYAVKQTVGASSTKLRGSGEANVAVAAALGVTAATFQRITDKAWVLFREKAAAAGFEVVDAAGFMDLPIYDDDKKYPHMPVAMPEDLEQENLACATATPTGFTTLVPGVNPMKVAKAFKDKDVLVVKAAMGVSFVNFDARSSKIGIAARVSWKEDIALASAAPCPTNFLGAGAGLTSIMTQAPAQYGYGFGMGLKKNLSAGTELGDWVEAFEKDTNIGILGYKSNFSGHVLKIDAAVYEEAVLAQIGRYFDYYFAELARLNN